MQRSIKTKQELQSKSKVEADAKRKCRRKAKERQNLAMPTSKKSQKTALFQTTKADMSDAEEAIACERARYQALADACETMVMLSEWLDMAAAAAREFAALPVEQP